MNAKILYNLTDVEGVYDSDPDENSDAKLISKMSINELEKLISKFETKAGHYPLFDFTAIQIIKRSRIFVHFINGKNPENLSKAIAGEKVGTIITH